MIENDPNFKSPFLENRDKLLENNVGFVIYDGFPVSEGHCIIIPHRVYSNYFDSTEDEVIGLQKLVVGTKKLLDKKYQPDGYNIGINCGEDGGQTVPHVHIHLIPRYKGDVEDPRGGVRGVLPSKQKY
jgi:diadenosine tetraphosphate (Ap4A) HIT family hydrolase